MFLRQTPLHLGFGGDQIRETLDLDKIEFAILKSTPREFSGFRMSQTWNDVQLSQNGIDDRPATMNLKLSTVFASERCRRIKEKYKSLIQNVTVSIANRSQSCLPW